VIVTRVIVHVKMTTAVSVRNMVVLGRILVVVRSTVARIMNVVVYLLFTLIRKYVFGAEDDRGYGGDRGYGDRGYGREQEYGREAGPRRDERDYGGMNLIVVFNFVLLILADYSREYEKEPERVWFLDLLFDARFNCVCSVRSEEEATTTDSRKVPCL